MTEEGHNGYFNYETWNVCLWCDNDYGIYMQTQEMLESGKFTARRAERYIRELFPEGTPDMRASDMSYDDVDWQEVADNFNAV